METPMDVEAALALIELLKAPIFCRATVIDHSLYYNNETEQWTIVRNVSQSKRRTIYAGDLAGAVRVLAQVAQ